MPAGNGYRPPTPREMAHDDLITDRGRGRRYCPAHPSQEMVPLLAGVDVCPLPHDEGDSAS
jgi:hypothetical protein